jgi:hypothetical protein
MSEALCLSDEEIATLTKKQRRHTQLRELRHMGLYHAVRVRSDGSFVVLRQLIETSKKETGPGLTLERLRGTQKAQH